MSGPATLGQLREHVQAGYRKIGRGFRRPDADWPFLVIVIQSPQGVEPATIPEELLEHGWQKAIVRDVLGEAMRLYGVFRFVLVVNVHSAVLDRSTRSEEIIARVRHEEMRIEDLPEAQEHLYLVAGDAETEEHWRARIRRDGRRPPTLGPWERLDRDADSITGRFAGLNEALR